MKVISRVVFALGIVFIALALLVRHAAEKREHAPAHRPASNPAQPRAAATSSATTAGAAH